MSGYPSSIFPQHVALLEGSGIPPGVATERGYVSVDTKARLKALGFGESQRRQPGLLIPIWNVAGERATFQYRPDEPRERDGRPVKYETPTKARMVLDVPRRCHSWVGDPSRPLFITEGARKADAAAARGLCCLALLGVWGWRGTNGNGGKTALPDWEFVALNGRAVYVVFDSDVTVKPDVREALERRWAFLDHRGASVRIVYLPAGEGGVKTGLDDYLAAGHTVDELLALARPEFPPEVANPKPRPRYEGPPVELAALLDDLAAIHRRYVVMTPEQADTLALHDAHTHAIEHFETTPYAHVRSAEMRSGKSTTLKLKLELVARPRSSLNISDAAIYRIVDMHPEATPPTFVMDEVDRVFYASRNGEQSRPELAGLINGGYQRGPLGYATRMTGEGANVQPKDYRTFSPKILAGIRDLPSTIADRAIPIVLKRKAPGETVAKFRIRRVRAETRPLRERLEAWAASDGLAVLATAEPAMPPGLHDRQEDLWEPLLAIADLAGGDWPLRARAAAVRISQGASAEENHSAGIRLLADTRIVFNEKQVDWLASTELIAALSEIEESRWGTWYRGNPISTTKLASLLKPYEVKPKRRRLGEQLVRGYEKAAFKDAWERYTPAESAPGDFQPGTGRNNPHGYAENNDSATRYTEPSVPGWGTRANRHGYTDVPTCAGLETHNGAKPVDDTMIVGCIPLAEDIVALLSESRWNLLEHRDGYPTDERTWHLWLAARVAAGEQDRLEGTLEDIRAAISPDRPDPLGVDPWSFDDDLMGI